VHIDNFISGNSREQKNIQKINFEIFLQAQRACRKTQNLSLSNFFFGFFKISRFIVNLYIIALLFFNTNG